MHVTEWRFRWADVLRLASLLELYADDANHYIWRYSVNGLIDEYCKMNEALV